MTDNLVNRLRMWARFGHCVEHVVEAEATMEEAANHIEKLEAALEKISRERTLWGAMRKADHALGKFENKALEGKDD